MLHGETVRGAAQFVIREMRGALTVAEIGVDRGYNAYAMFRNMDIEFLVLIDPYLSYAEMASTDYPEYILMQAQDRLAPWREKTVFMFQTSQRASKFFPNEFFDFVYIDADHNYESVKADLSIWYDKVKIGGVLGGHDYSHLNSVSIAVDEFVDERGLKLEMLMEVEELASIEHLSLEDKQATIEKFTERDWALKRK